MLPVKMPPVPHSKAQSVHFHPLLFVQLKLKTAGIRHHIVSLPHTHTCTSTRTRQKIHNHMHFLTNTHTHPRAHTHTHTHPHTHTHTHARAKPLSPREI